MPDDDPYFTAPAAGKHFHPNLWPERPRDLRAAWTAYFRAMGDLATAIMRMFATALDEPEDFFDDKVDRHISRLRVRNPPRRPLRNRNRLRRLKNPSRLQLRRPRGNRRQAARA